MERTWIFLVSAPDNEGEVVSEVITPAARTAKKEAVRPQPPQGFAEFREQYDSVVKAYAEYNGLSRHRLAAKCGVSYTTIKYWCKGRSCPSHSLYSSVFKDYFLNVYLSEIDKLSVAE